MIRENLFAKKNADIFIYQRKIILPDKSIIKEHIKILKQEIIIFSVKLEYVWLNDCMSEGLLRGMDETSMKNFLHTRK